jgi:hypothetical protein
MNPKSESGILKSLKDTVSVGIGLTSQDDDNVKRDGDDVDRAIEGLLARVENEGEAVFFQSELKDDEKKRLVLALKKMQQYYKGDPASVVAA